MPCVCGRGCGVFVGVDVVCLWAPMVAYGSVRICWYARARSMSARMCATLSVSFSNIPPSLPLSFAWPRSHTRFARAQTAPLALPRTAGAAARQGGREVAGRGEPVATPQACTAIQPQAGKDKGTPSCVVTPSAACRTSRACRQVPSRPWRGSPCCIGASTPALARRFAYARQTHR